MEKWSLSEQLLNTKRFRKEPVVRKIVWSSLIILVGRPHKIGPNATATTLVDWFGCSTLSNALLSSKCIVTPTFEGILYGIAYYAEIPLNCPSPSALSTTLLLLRWMQYTCQVFPTFEPITLIPESEKQCWRSSLLIFLGSFDQYACSSVKSRILKSLTSLIWASNIRIRPTSFILSFSIKRGFTMVVNYLSIL